LKPADVEAKSVALRDEAKTLAATICATTLDEKSTEILKIVLRRRMVEEILSIVADLDQQARRNGEEIRSYSIHEGKEVWTYFFLGKENVGCGTTIMRPESAPFVAAEMMNKRPIWHARHELFRELIEDLKREILEGKHDEELTAKPERFIYDSLRDRV
jgi:hypothetical protein